MRMVKMNARFLSPYDRKKVVPTITSHLPLYVIYGVTYHEDTTFIDAATTLPKVSIVTRLAKERKHCPGVKTGYDLTRLRTILTVIV